MPRHERIVWDQLEPCPYLPDRVARLPLRRQLVAVRGAELDEALAEGDRRVGSALYRPRCPECRACEPIRIPVAEFRPSRSQRRVARRNADLRIELGPPEVGEERLALFNRHKLERGLADDGDGLSEDAYAGWLVRSCSPTLEFRYYDRDRLVGVGIVDVGGLDTSSVYFYFDPDEARRSLGVYSVIAEVAWLRSRGGRHHYLGLYAERSPRLAYKADYHPHERRIDGVWRRFERGGSPAAADARG